MTSPDDALRALEAMALDAEREHPNSISSLRTVEHPITDSVRLQVQARYTDWGESMAFMNTRALENRYLKPRLAYGIVAPGRLAALGISRDEAVALLTTRQLPARWYATQERELMAPDAADEDGWSVTEFLATVKPTAVRHRVGKVGTR